MGIEESGNSLGEVSMLITNCYVNRYKNRDRSMYIPKDERIQVMRDVGDSALILYEFYVTRATRDGYQFTDSDAAENLGWTERKVQKMRLKLTQSHYFYQVGGRLNDGTKTRNFFLGKKKVLDALGIRELAPWELMGITKRVIEELNLPDDDSLAQDKQLKAEARKLYEIYKDEEEHTMAPVNKRQAMRDELDELREAS